jgi:5'-deoxynucleotidase YfbR-like HD superfamily hydrolase
MLKQEIDITGLYGTGNMIRTFTGLYIDVNNPRPDMFNIVDIAHALSMQPRFGGHLYREYSVAQHSIECALICEPSHMFAALMHDASEAYLCDIPSPIKKLIPDYRKLEDKLMYAISEKFRFRYPLSAQVHEADQYMLELEWSAFVRGKGSIQYIESEKIKTKFLNLFHTLVV